MREKLRRIYEQELGRRISDRQWDRIKKVLSVTGLETGLTFEQAQKDVKTFAFLRRANRNQRIELSDVRVFQEFSEIAQKVVQKLAEEKEVSGELICEVLNNLTPQPHSRTIIRWGKQIKTPLKPNKTYNASQTFKWLMRISTQTRFKFLQKETLCSTN